VHQYGHRRPHLYQLRHAQPHGRNSTLRSETQDSH
jgi:hypothetical protein